MANKRYRKRCPGCRRVSRRQFLTQAACAGMVLTGGGLLQSACSPAGPAAVQADGSGQQTPLPKEDPSRALPTADGSWVPSEPWEGDLPEGTNEIRIGDVGTFAFDAAQVTAIRTDIFQPGHYSMFDILSHLDERGDIQLESHFDQSADTHVIDAIDGEHGWWYQTYYAAGWREDNVFRMDMYPYKNGSVIRLHQERERRLAAIHRTFQEEVSRLAENGGQIIIPKLEIRSPTASRTFEDVLVIPHDVRSDVLQPGVVTALDALLSLQEQAKLSNIGLTWYEQIGAADPVDSYWVNRVDEDEAVGGCGFVYETGPREFSGFSGSHIHLPSDVRVTISPEYALWFWICLGMGR